MPRPNDAEVFIRVLTELWEEDRKLKKARLHLELKAHVRRFVEEFRIERKGGGPSPNWALRHTRSEGPSATPMPGE